MPKSSIPPLRLNAMNDFASTASENSYGTAGDPQRSMWQTTYFTPKQPHKCPVCDGRGIMPSAFYEVPCKIPSVDGSEWCRACEGKGILWEL